MCNHHMHLRCFLAVARWLQVTASSIVGKKEAQSDKDAIAKPFKEAMLAQKAQKKDSTRALRAPGSTAKHATYKAEENARQHLSHGHQ